MTQTQKYTFDQVFSFEEETSKRISDTVLTKQLYLRDEVEELLKIKEEESFELGAQKTKNSLEKIQEEQLTLLTQQLHEKANEFDSHFQKHCQDISIQAIELASAIALKFSHTHVNHDLEKHVINFVKEKLPLLKKHMQLDIIVPDNLVPKLNSIKDKIMAEANFCGTINVSASPLPTPPSTNTTLPHCTISWQTGEIGFDQETLNNEINTHIQQYIQQITSHDADNVTNDHQNK